MAKKSMIERERKRRQLVKKYQGQRDKLRTRVVDLSESGEDRFQAMMELQKLPRDSSAVRRRNRCEITGRSRGYYRKFGLSRSKLREILMKGEAPGVVKASW